MANFRLPPPYTIIRHLGKGGIGEIYLAYHENLQKQVIVKKVKDHCVDIMDSRIEVDILKICIIGICRRFMILSR